MKLFSVKRIALFGSFIHDNQSEKSDIDILVELKEETFSNFINLKFFLEDLFGRKVDLVTEEGLKPRLKYIKEEAIYAKVA